MAINCYLAMTAAEIQGNTAFPPHIAWMACHFSPYGLALSNLPRELPEGSMLILNDRIPISGHDPAAIARQLADTSARLKCDSILLDFQRPGNPETTALAKYLLESLPCPTAVSQSYAMEGFPVFLPPVPMDTPLEAHLAPWAGQEIWLEIARESLCLRLTSSGCTSEPICLESEARLPHRSKALHCRYRIELAADCAVFCLHRTQEDLEDLLTAAESFPVTRAVGLWQELQ